MGVRSLVCLKETNVAGISEKTTRGKQEKERDTTMETTTQEGVGLEQATLALVIGLTSGTDDLRGVAAEVDAALDGLLTRLRAGGEIKGAAGETTVLHTLGRLQAERVVVAGLGGGATISVEVIRRAAAGAVRAVRKAGLTSFSSALYGAEALGAAAAAGAIVEGSTLGLYRFDGYRAHEETTTPSLTLMTGSYDADAVAEGVRHGAALAAGVTFARDLINEPANVLTPTEMARRVEVMAEEYGITYQMLDKAAMREIGMEGVLAVSAGSDQLPAFIVARYGTPREGTPALGLVGKGITFDSGGISIKPAENMHKMKGDMGGAAAVLGALRAIAALKLDVAVTVLVPAAENLLGGSATRPGDVVRALNGVTIEVLNTDAEGRIVLADALSYGVREGLSPLVDAATLTGAAGVALGLAYTAVFANDEKVAGEILEAGTTAGEYLWRMPLPEVYEELIKGETADIKNSAGRYGGAITAALFLQHFVGSTPWVHLDIAPPSWSDKDEGEQTKGGSGAGVRTLVAFVESLAHARSQAG